MGTHPSQPVIPKGATQTMTLIKEPRKMKKQEVTYTTREVLSMTGLSFRVLDWWLRTGVVILVENNTPGSGKPRMYTPGEVEAIKRLADRYHSALAEIETIRSGKAWMDEVVA